MPEDFGYYWNEYGDLIGHVRDQVRTWLEEHPSYRATIMFDLGQDDPQVTFRPEDFNPITDNRLLSCADV